MVKILALDASTEYCSVALLGPSQEVLLQSDEPRSHAQKLLPMVDEVLQASGVLLKELDAIAFGSGPGSFTGLRIGLGIAQGLAYGAEIPMTAVSSLEAMAHSAFMDCDDECSTAVCVLDARMGELYWAAYINVEGHTSVLAAPALDTPENCCTRIHELFAVSPPRAAGLFGPGVPMVESAIAPLFLAIEPSVYPSALSVAALGLRQLASGNTTPAELAELSYLRNSVSWNKRKKVRGPHA